MVWRLAVLEKRPLTGVAQEEHIERDWSMTVEVVLHIAPLQLMDAAEHYHAAPNHL